MTEGHYEQKHKANRLLRWSHGSRIERAVQLILRNPNGRVLDYGCGDGILERLLAQDPRWRGSVLAVDVDAPQIEDCRQRLSDLPRTVFAGMDALATEGGLDTVVCLEVLEHVPCVDAVLGDFARLLAEEGRLIISVPVETGVVLLAKQAVRFRLGGDYRYTERYSFKELLHALTPTSKTLPRPVYQASDGSPYHGHKLFNWRWLRSKLLQSFTIDEEFGTPLPWPASQHWFVCRPRATAKP